jgi:MFS transporter, DHA2 family, methylenomycin A resistance protein
VFAAIDSHRGGHAWMFSLLLSVLAVPCFLAAKHRPGEAALVPLELFRNRHFSGALVATASRTFGVYGMIFLLPLVWQASGLLAAEAAGLALLPCALVFFRVSQRSGHLTQRIGVRAMTTGGTAVIGCGLLVPAATRAGQPVALAAFGLALTGSRHGPEHRSVR